MPTSSGDRRADSEVQVLESCNSTWVFDAGRSRFRRVPKGTSVDIPVPASEWERYYSLDIDDDTGAFIVALNESGTRLLRSYRHSSPCPHCDANATAEVSLEAVRQALKDAPPS